MPAARIALVVPDLVCDGGLRSVAEFIRRTIRQRSAYDLKLISLAMSSADPSGVRLLKPSTIFAGARSVLQTYQGEAVIHVGALFSEIETQRLKPRRALTRALADCDVIQVVAGAPSWALPVVGLGKPVALQVATLTEVEREHARSRGNILRDAWHGLMTRRVGKLDLQALRQVDAIQVENPWMFELAQGIQSGEGKITRYAPPGTDTSHFTPLQTRDPAKGYILAVGRFQDARKNLPLLLEAYALVCTRSADAPKLVLAGASPPPKAFWEKAATKGLTDRIAYIASPSRDALASLYRNAQSFVLTSHEEGFGIVLTEAMASGIPVVATRCGGPEGIVSDGDDGFLVDEDSVTLADRLLSLCEDLDLNLGMGAAARVTAETRFSDTVTGDAFLETYDYLLRRSQQPRGY